MGGDPCYWSGCGMWTLSFGQTGSSESLDCEEVAVEESKSERHVGGR